MTRRKSDPDPEIQAARKQLESKLNELYPQLGQRLKDARAGARATHGLGTLSQDAVAHAVFGTRKGTLSAWERASRRIGAVELGMLANYYGVSCDTLILGPKKDTTPEVTRLVEIFNHLSEPNRQALLNTAQLWLEAIDKSPNEKSLGEFQELSGSDRRRTAT